MLGTIPLELEQFVEQALAGGRYQNVDEVVSDALRLLQAREQKLQDLRAEIQVGVDELDRGEAAPLDIKAIKDEVKQRLVETRNTR